MNKMIVAAAAVALAVGFSAPALAKFAKTETVTSTQGSSGKPAKDNANQGTTDTTTTVSGPKGQVKQYPSKNANTTVTTTTSGPGNSTKMP